MGAKESIFRKKVEENCPEKHLQKGVTAMRQKNTKQRSFWKTKFLENSVIALLNNRIWGLEYKVQISYKINENTGDDRIRKQPKRSYIQSSSIPKRKCQEMSVVLKTTHSRLKDKTKYTKAHCYGISETLKSKRRFAVSKGKELVKYQRMRIK